MAPDYLLEHAAQDDHVYVPTFADREALTFAIGHHLPFCCVVDDNNRRRTLHGSLDTNPECRIRTSSMKFGSHGGTLPAPARRACLCGNGATH